jgi:hypothetical protein
MTAVARATIASGLPSLVLLVGPPGRLTLLTTIWRRRVLLWRRHWRCPRCRRHGGRRWRRRIEMRNRRRWWRRRIEVGDGRRRRSWRVEALLRHRCWTALFHGRPIGVVHRRPLLLDTSGRPTEGRTLGLFRARLLRRTVCLALRFTRSVGLARGSSGLIPARVSRSVAIFARRVGLLVARRGVWTVIAWALHGR